jgi:hypothetical protein
MYNLFFLTPQKKPWSCINLELDVEANVISRVCHMLQDVYN